MDKNNTYGNALKKSAVLAVPLIISSAVVFRQVIFNITQHFPECWFYEATGWLCPACGNTRSVKALLRGELITSLRYNIVPFLCCITGGIFYIEALTLYFGKHIAIFPRSCKFAAVFTLLLGLYFILRNFVSVFDCV